jgi:phosphoglycerol transferase MdoB-like AlkP superfamily enzyme
MAAGCWLALMLVIAKALSHHEQGWSLSQRFLTLVATSFADVLFAIALGSVGATAAWLWPRAATLVRNVFLAAFTVCAVYGVVAVGVFRHFRRPLTYELLRLVGDAATIRSSVIERLTWPVALALLAAPAVFLFVSTRVRLSSRALSIALLAAGFWSAAGAALHLGSSRPRHLEALWVSPHAELIRTTAIGITGGQRPALPRDFSPEYVEEFRTFGARRVPAASTFQLPAGAAPPRNVLVIVLESVGTKYLRLYGHKDEFMPNLSGEAQHALVFENIYAHASFSYAAFRTLHFSVYPGLPWRYALIGDARPVPRTLARAMRERGARTGFFMAGDLDWSDQRWLLERSGGFETMQGAADLGCPLLSSWGVEDRCLFDRLLEWINTDAGRPFFAICWTDQTHDPFLASAGAAPSSRATGDAQAPFAEDLSRYLNNVREVDAQLARVFAFLRERGLADDTLVVVTGDHGEAFGDPHPQRGHAWSVYEEEVRVPLLFWNPRLFPNGGRVDAIGGHVDLNPTLADMLELEPDRAWQGHNLFDPERPQRTFLMAIAGGHIFGLREGQWKYAYDVTSARESLFDLATDPEEQQDVASKHPELSLQMRRRVAAWVAFEDAFLAGREN